MLKSSMCCTEHVSAGIASLTYVLEWQDAHLVCCDHLLLIHSQHVVHVVHCCGLLQDLPLIIVLLLVNHLQHCQLAGQSTQKGVHTAHGFGLHGSKAVRTVMVLLEMV